MARRTSSLGFILRPSRNDRMHEAVKLCRAVQRARREAPHLVQPVCRKLRETLASFGRESPEAKIRSRACGCPV